MFLFNIAERIIYACTLPIPIIESYSMVPIGTLQSSIQAEWFISTRENRKIKNS